MCAGNAPSLFVTQMSASDPSAHRRRHSLKTLTVLSWFKAFMVIVNCTKGRAAKGGTMQSTSHPMLSAADGLANKYADIVILVGRIMLAWVFVGVAYGAMTNFAGSLAYFTSQKLYSPALWTWMALLIEVLISVSLILGVGTRYSAILAFVFVLIATAIAHRYWEFPAGPQQFAQYNNFLKNISIMGGALAIFVTGAGRFSLDRVLAK
jgi:putative oxidoreductase